MQIPLLSSSVAFFFVKYYVVVFLKKNNLVHHIIINPIQERSLIETRCGVFGFVLDSHLINFPFLSSSPRI